jgi:hypothetical protein
MFERIVDTLLFMAEIAFAIVAIGILSVIEMFTRKR